MNTRRHSDLFISSLKNMIYRGTWPKIDSFKFQSLDKLQNYTETLRKTRLRLWWWRPAYHHLPGWADFNRSWIASSSATLTALTGQMYPSPRLWNKFGSARCQGSFRQGAVRWTNGYDPSQKPSRVWPTGLKTWARLARRPMSKMLMELAIFCRYLIWFEDRTAAAEDWTWLGCSGNLMWLVCSMFSNVVLWYGISSHHLTSNVTPTYWPTPTKGGS